MGISQTTICNIALSRVTAPRIQDITDAVREAKECRLIYDVMRDLALSDYDWSFARGFASLAVTTGNDIPGWTYAYQVPADCIKVRKIYNSLEGLADPIPFEVIGRLLYTNEEDAQIVYTKRITDSSLFDSAFVDALAWRLSSELAVPLKNSINLREANYKMYLMSVSKATQTSLNSGFTEVRDTNTFESARE